MDLHKYGLKKLSVFYFYYNSLYLTSCGAFLRIDSPTLVYFAEITGTVSPLALAKFAGTKS